MPATGRKTNKQKIMKGPNDDRSAAKAGSKLVRNRRKRQVDAINASPRKQRRGLAKSFIKRNQRKS